jgi:hypothetical protein
MFCAKNGPHPTATQLGDQSIATSENSAFQSNGQYSHIANRIAAHQSLETPERVSIERESLYFDRFQEPRPRDRSPSPYPNHPGEPFEETRIERTFADATSTFEGPGSAPVRRFTHLLRARAPI